MKNSWEHTCPYCNESISSAQSVRPGHCGGENCTYQHIVKSAREREAERDTENAQALSAVAELVPDALKDAANLLGCTPTELVLSKVPFQNAPVTSLPDERREAFVEYLNTVADTVFSIDPDDLFVRDYHVSGRSEPPIVDAACATCQGLCCKKGAENFGYLDRKLAQFQRIQNPDLTAKEFVTYYTEALPEVSTQDSCVFHGPVGCVLPREKRSARCNSFYCRDLHDLHAATGGRADVPVAIIAVEAETPRAVAAFNADMGRQVVAPFDEAADLD